MNNQHNNQNGYYPPNQGYYPPNQYYQPPQYGQPMYQPPYFDQQQYMMQQDIVRRRNQQKSELRKIGVGIGVALMLYLVIQTVSGSVLGALGLSELYSTSPVFQSCFSVFAEVLGVAAPFGIMALIFKKKYEYPVVPTAKLGKADAAAWIGVGMAVCIGANYIAGIVEMMFKSIGKSASGPKGLDPDSLLACIIEWVAIAIIPPICEEFAMRCCTMSLLRKYGKGFALMAVSLIFGIMHGNILQFVFAFIVGLILAYVTIRTDSVLPAMFIHGFNNGRSTLNNTVQYLTNEKTAEAVTLVITVLWIVAGVAGIVYLAAKKKLAPPKTAPDTDPAQLTMGAKLSCLIPGMAVPTIILILLAIYTLATSQA